MCWLQSSAELWRYPTFLLYPLLLIACIECFAGYHAWRFLLGFNGAILGLVVGACAGAVTGIPLLILVGAPAGALAGVLLFAGVVPAGSVLFAFATLVSFGCVMGRLAGLPHAFFITFSVLFGIAGAIAALTLRRPFMITLSAFAGAFQMSCAWSAHSVPSGEIPLPDVVNPAEWLLCLALAAAGLVIQFATSRPARPLSEAAAIREAV